MMGVCICWLSLDCGRSVQRQGRPLYRHIALHRHMSSSEGAHPWNRSWLRTSIRPFPKILRAYSMPAPSTPSHQSGGEPLSESEVIRLTLQVDSGDWHAAKELGMRYLTYGAQCNDYKKAEKWLEQAGQAEEGKQDAELWYARGIAVMKVDRGLSPAEQVAGTNQSDDGCNSLGPLYEEQVEKETYGAKTGVEFVRVIRRRTNKHKHARSEEEPFVMLHPRHRRAFTRFHFAAELGHINASVSPNEVRLGNLLCENADYKDPAPTEPQRVRRCSEAAMSAPRRTSAHGRPTNLQRAVECYEKVLQMTQSRHADALFNLGVILYDGGLGVPPQPVKAVEYLKLAAELAPENQHMAAYSTDDGSASFWLGHAYRVGEPGAGLPADLHRSLNYLKQACEAREHPGACYYLATLYHNGDSDLGLEPNQQLFARFLKRAEQLGDPDALFCLADMHLHGTEGVSVDEEKAMDYYRRAGRAGHAEALVSLGALLHARGQYEEAVRIYERAGELGSVQAWRNLASCYLLGQGVQQNERMGKHILQTMGR